MIAIAVLFAGLVGLPAVNPPAPPADPSLAEIADENFEIPAHDYRFVPAHIANWPATLFCSIEVAHGSPVRVELVSKQELGKFVRGRPHGFLVELEDRRKAEFRQPVPEKGDYDVLFVNDGVESTKVRLAAIVQFAREPDVAKYLPPQKRLTVILLSLLCFVVTVTWSTFGLVRAMRRGSPQSRSFASARLSRSI